MLQYLRANLAFFNLLTSLVEHRVYCDKSPGGVVAMIPQSFPLLPTLLIHSDKTLLSLIRQLCSPAGLAGKKNDGVPRLCSSDIWARLQRLMRIQAIKFSYIIVTNECCFGRRNTFVSNFPFSYCQSHQICAPCGLDMSFSFSLLW